MPPTERFSPLGATTLTLLRFLETRAHVLDA